MRDEWDTSRRDILLRMASIRYEGAQRSNGLEPTKVELQVESSVNAI